MGQVREREVWELCHVSNLFFSKLVEVSFKTSV